MKKTDKKNKAKKKTDTKQNQKKIRYAVAGLGYISQIAVLPAFAHASENSELTALISSDSEKLKKLGKKYNVKNLFLAEDYEQCLNSGLVDAVYIALPNSAHCAYTLAAAKAGVHVLCEKPMAVTVEECEQMIEACEKAAVRLMIAYRLHFDSATLQAIETVKSGKLGDLRIFSSVFSFPIQDKNNIRLQYDLGGGPLFDLGIYCINAARYLFQSEPIEVTATPAAKKDAKFKEVEEMMSVLMRFPGQKLAQFTCSFGAVDASQLEVFGTKGSVKLEPAYDFAVPLEIATKIGEKERRKKYPKTDQFAPELLYFSDCVLKGKQPEPSGNEGLIDVSIISKIYQASAEGRSIQLTDVRKNQRPNLKLLMTCPPIQEPELIRAMRPAAS